MDFRPFAKHFVNRTYEAFTKHMDEEGTPKVRSHSQVLSRAPFPQQEPSSPVYHWELELKKMRQRVHTQRLDIKRRDIKFKENLEEHKKLTELRGVVMKRKAQTIALKYRHLVKARKEDRENLDEMEVRPDSPVFVTLPETPKSAYSFRRERKYPVTPHYEYLNRCYTPKLSIIRVN